MSDQSRDYKPLRAPGRGPGGWYCDHCGYTTRHLPSGAVVCAGCGRMGLMGFLGKGPMLMPCIEDGCPEKVWIDGVNSYPARLRRLHADHRASMADCEPYERDQPGPNPS